MEQTSKAECAWGPVRGGALASETRAPSDPSASSNFGASCRQSEKLGSPREARVASFPVLAVFRTGAAIAQEARRPAEFEQTEPPFGPLRIPSCCLKHFKA